MSAPGDAAGRSGAAPHSGQPLPPLVAFDFDGTLTVRDSFTAFLRWRTDATRWAAGLLRLSPEVLAYPVLRDRGRLKSASVRTFLQGTSKADLAAQAEDFARAAWRDLLRPDALAAWTRHQRDGDRLVIVTASPEEVVAPFARRLQAEALIGSRLAWTADGRVGAGLEGANCRGAAKVERLRERFGPKVSLAHAYGDTSGDREMLAFAHRGHLRAFNGRP